MARVPTPGLIYPSASVQLSLWPSSHFVTTHRPSWPEALWVSPFAGASFLLVKWEWSQSFVGLYRIYELLCKVHAVVSGTQHSGGAHSVLLALIVMITSVFQELSLHRWTQGSLTPTAAIVETSWVKAGAGPLPLGIWPSPGRGWATWRETAGDSEYPSRSLPFLPCYMEKPPWKVLVTIQRPLYPPGYNALLVPQRTLYGQKRWPATCRCNFNNFNNAPQMCPQPQHMHFPVTADQACSISKLPQETESHLLLSVFTP